MLIIYEVRDNQLMIHKFIINNVSMSRTLNLVRSQD